MAEAIAWLTPSSHEATLPQRWIVCALIKLREPIMFAFRCCRRSRRRCRLQNGVRSQPHCSAIPGGGDHPLRAGLDLNCLA